MPKTLLAVDDSATMRKVLEITFGGEDFRVVTADGASTALSRLGEEPVAAVIDTSLGGDDGYALAKELRSRQPRLALVVMASRYSPYDANRGRDAGVDDYIDKPFDTQALIEKVKKALVSRETREAARPAPAPSPRPRFSNRTPPGRPSPRRPLRRPRPRTSAHRYGQGRVAHQRTHTLSFEGGLPVVPAPAPRESLAAPAPAAARASGSPCPGAARRPARCPPRPSRAPRLRRLRRRWRLRRPLRRARSALPWPARTASSRASSATSGLTAQQADAVLALSREVVERVVWEVVPQLAEALIKEEIARLTKER